MDSGELVGVVGVTHDRVCFPDRPARRSTLVRVLPGKPCLSGLGEQA